MCELEPETILAHLVLVIFLWQYCWNYFEFMLLVPINIVFLITTWKSPKIGYMNINVF